MSTAHQVLEENKEAVKTAAKFVNEHKEEVKAAIQFANEHKEEARLNRDRFFTSISVLVTSDAIVQVKQAANAAAKFYGESVARPRASDEYRPVHTSSPLCLTRHLPEPHSGGTRRRFTKQLRG